MGGCQWYVLEVYVRNIFGTNIKLSNEYKEALGKTPSKRLLLTSYYFNLASVVFPTYPQSPALYR